MIEQSRTNTKRSRSMWQRLLFLAVLSVDYTGTLTVSPIVDRSPSISAADMITFRRAAGRVAERGL